MKNKLTNECWDIINKYANDKNVQNFGEFRGACKIALTTEEIYNSAGLIKDDVYANYNINLDGKIEYKGEVFRIQSGYQHLSKDKKLEMLILLINWGNDELEKLNQNL